MNPLFSVSAALVGLVRFGRGLGAQAVVRVLEQAPRREAGELLVELRAEEGGRIRIPASGVARLGEMRQALGDDELGFFRRAAL